MKYNQILRSNNKIKTTWETVKVDSGKRIHKNNKINMQEINVDGGSTDNPQLVISVFNDYFLSVGEKLSHKTTMTTTTSIMVLMILINIVAPLIVIHHSMWLMPLTTPFRTYNSNFQQQRKLKTKLNSVACSPQANYTDRAATAC
jgi:hypothetical protein